MHAYVRIDLPNPSMCSVMRCYLCCLIMSTETCCLGYFGTTVRLQLCIGQPLTCAPPHSLTHPPLLHWFLSLSLVCLSASQSVSLGFATGRWDTNVGVGEQIQIYDCRLMNGGGGRLLAYITCRRRRKKESQTPYPVLYEPNAAQVHLLYIEYIQLPASGVGLGFDL